MRYGDKRQNPQEESGSVFDRQAVGASLSYIEVWDAMRMHSISGDGHTGEASSTRIYPPLIHMITHIRRIRVGEPQRSIPQSPSDNAVSSLYSYGFLPSLCAAKITSRRRRFNLPALSRQR